MQVIIVKNQKQGIERAKEELYTQVDNKTVLFLSGGSTPRPLYEMLAQEKIIKPAAVALVDERFGDPLHQNSNERMIADTGFLGYLRTQKIPVNLILQKGKTPQEVASDYDETVRNLFFHFPKSIGIVGIGKDGHTSSVIPNRKDFHNPMFDGSQKHLFVSQFTDNISEYGTRVGLTFSGLALLDKFVILSFGKEKQKALKKMFERGSFEEIPARFYNSEEIGRKTLLLTDQRV
ncbi:MAG: 6-phosphogluconolactonase [Patescibacteria group bacterium]|nr:6-phosphogluconolactonase [Patescibacteria group bacterium]MDE2590513.1 6-phosphogluconolactonase [Patescibacteria group bacterium]